MIGPMSTTTIKASHKAIQAYYDQLHAYDAQGVGHESALRSAFQNLLAETARVRGWTLVPELSLKVRGKTVRPDGTLRDDQWHLPRGYWEAKDTDDVLDDEIRKKVARGYPLVNTIFEDTRQAVLFQNGAEVFRVDARDPARLSDLLNQFYNHTERDIEGFEQAVGEFQERIPHLAQGLLAKIREAHAAVPRFQAAFDALLELCQTSLNPNLSVAAVDEMLVQHLLTERLFRTVFDNADFIKRNVIAAEVETVIEALVSKSFNRAEFLKALDPFYKAIESTARTIEDFSQKQHFLNSVYERFFQGYSVKLADTHGIVYTPQAIVDFMCASVEEVLRSEFGRRLGGEGVHILDPCTGTGNFLVNLLRRIEPRDLPRAYKSQLFANEVMLLPYYIASQNIEHEYFDLTGTYEPFEGLCFVDTLELAEAQQPTLSFMTEENTARVNREKSAAINVIIGNPPYNVGQLNENDNNKNRKYEVIDKKIRETYARDSSASSVSKITDAYVRFFRWATDRLKGRDGIVCFISNNQFLHGVAFDGFRKHVASSFNLIYHFDLRGNGRLIGERRTRDGRNIFSDQIRVGVGITLLARSKSRERLELFYHAVPDFMKAEEKKKYVASFGTLSDVPWRALTPDARNTWLVPENEEEFSDNISIGSRAAKVAKGAEPEVLFKTYTLGVTTNRDEVVYSFNRVELKNRVVQFIEDYNAEVDRFRRTGAGAVMDDFVKYDRIKWSRDLKLDLQRGNYAQFDERKFRMGLYRPFCKMHLFYDKTLNEEIRLFPFVFPTTEAQAENRLIVTSDIGSRSPVYNVIMTDCIPECHLCSSTDSHQCFPFYVYDEGGSNRRENITDWALTRFREYYVADTISKWDIFHYVYGVLHQPAYREKFADNLKRELPRIPFMGDFRAIAEAGERLAELHLKYEQVEPWPLRWIYTPGMPLSYHVEKMRLSKDKATLVVNETLSLGDIPPEAFSYRLGNRSALEWVIDQYQVSEDRRSGIRTDPNRADDPEYIVRLVERVVRVSAETVGIVNGLPVS
jgi:predicted helicase